ncbi:WYL domain-containing protein [Diaminobutyricimonas sp. TR449]|uniref:helix-turn-helix transcriptional regulator n=1 Tax=Diaminobutyricimonas sp. TR449 TaxID=2708076 RepID=UPI00141DCA19|nr:WYL domain-containing protein [Diaminobutyricimonas sp. TR449]
MAETTSRALALLSLLQTHRQWPGPELAARLGVTERTLRRDVERLRELGYQVDAIRGAAGGYRLEAGSRLPPLLLTDEEAVTMAIGLRVAATQGLVDGEQTTMSALAKFEQVLPSALRERVHALGKVQATTPRGAPVSQDLLGRLALACRDHERIRFHYVAASGDESDRVVEPHTLVAAERNWFLVCWDLQRADWRTFRVDRMSRLFPTRVHFTARELPADDAAEFVRVAVSSVPQRFEASVILDLPLSEMQANFGPWARGAEAVDATHTRWPIGGESLEALLSALVWIPAGVGYRLDGPAEFLALARDAAARLAAAT